jgi:hypothetical protein
VKFRVKVGYSSLFQIFSRKATEPGQELGNRKDGDRLIASRTLSEFSVPLLPECRFHRDGVRLLSTLAMKSRLRMDADLLYRKLQRAQ